MERIPDSNQKNTSHNRKTHQLKKYAVVSLLIAVLMFSVACALFNSEKDEASFQQEIIGMIATKGDSEPEATEAPGSADEPAQQSGQPQSSGDVSVASGPNGYTVSAENFNCVCQEVSGIVTQELRVEDDHLEIVDADGVGIVYEKIGENTYKRSWMGYYILKNEGEDTGTKVDREEWVVITLTDDGYSMSQYREDESSPCCIHTFTQAD